MREIRKALLAIRQKVEASLPLESVPVIFPGDEEPATGQFIRVQVVDASRNSEDRDNDAENHS